MYAIFPSLISEARSTDPCSSLNHKSVAKGDLAAARFTTEKSYPTSEDSGSSIVHSISLKGLSSSKAFNIMLVAPNEIDLSAMEELRKCVLVLKSGKRVTQLKVSQSSNWVVNCEIE